MIRWVGARFVRPIPLDRVLFAFSVLVLNVSVFIGLLGVISSRNDVQDQLKASDSVAACRNKISANQSNTQTDYLLDIGSIVLAAPVDRAELARKARVDGDSLAAARDVRLAFEANPSQPCPIP